MTAERIDEFIADLNEFATGSYLREGETENWDPPFDADVLPELRQLLNESVERIEEGPLPEAVANSVEKLQKFNDAHIGAVLDDEEWSFIRDLFHDTARRAGASDEDIEELPEIDY